MKQKNAHGNLTLPRNGSEPPGSSRRDDLAASNACPSVACRLGVLRWRRRRRGLWPSHQVAPTKVVGVGVDHHGAINHRVLPKIFINLSVILDFAMPSAPASILPRSPTWRSSSSGPPWFL